MANITCKNITLTVPGRHLLVNTDLIISEGVKYALIGYNGMGKSSLLKHINDKAFGIPPDTDVFYVEQEVIADPNLTVFQMVLDANTPRRLLIEKYNTLKYIVEHDDNATEKQFNEYQQVMNDLKIINADKDESIVRYILFGLGFDNENQNKPTNQFSGGWRMRISLARALYLKPKLLLLDEPTSHLDLEAVIWLTSYLCDEWKNTLIVVSHDKKFINDVCNMTIHLFNQKLTYYKGNYDNFLKASEENRRHMDKEWAKVEKQILEMRKKGTKKAEVDKFIAEKKHLEPPKPYNVRISFENVIPIKSQLIKLDNVTFGFDNSDPLFENIDLVIDHTIRAAIVGKNGVGKSTLLKVMLGQFPPSSGSVIIDQRVKIGYYNQHSTDVLPFEFTAVDYLLSIDGSIGIQGARQCLGSIGLEGKLHNNQIGTLSGGQKARVVFASLVISKPHILFLDEPSNFLDMETIDALIEAINEFKGGVVMITHNVDMIEKTNSILWELENKTIIETDYEDYHNKIIEEISELLS